MGLGLDLDWDKADEKERTAVEIDEGEVVEGFYFARLIANYPNYHSQLLTLRDQLLSASGQGKIQQLKRWEIKG